MENRLIKNFCFIEENRDFITLSDIDKIRLNTEVKTRQGIQLKADDNGNFSTDDDINVATEQIEPQALMKWLLFEAIFERENTNFDLPAGTSLGFRITTQADDYFWDGGNWVVAGASDWNTEAEIRINISTLPIATIGSKKIGLRMNLKTTDPKATPFVNELKLAGEFDVDYFDDLVYDSVIRLLNTQFRSTSVLRFVTDSSSNSSIDLASILENKGYNIFDVKTVYNLSDDPLKLTNLHDSYAPGAVKQDGFTFEYGTETFSTAIPDGKLVEVKFIYVPEISIKTNQDFYEIPSYPHITIPRITPVERRGFIMRDTNSQGKDSIRDKENDTALVQRSPSQNTYRFDFMLHTTEIDQFRLLGDVKRFFANVKEIITHGLYNKHPIQIIDEIDTVGNSTTNDNTDTNLAKGSFDIIGVLFYDIPSIEIPLVTDVNLNFTRQTL